MARTADQRTDQSLERWSAVCRFSSLNGFSADSGVFSSSNLPFCLTGPTFFDPFSNLFYTHLILLWCIMALGAKTAMATRYRDFGIYPSRKSQTDPI
jgi:hypothetical protein